MLREGDLSEISDGKLYSADDLVKVGCNECDGCSDCCRQTGDSIILDPYDMYRLTTGLHKRFEDMIEHEIEIRMVDGLILPNLMEHDEEHPERPDQCPFLNEKGRCSIHSFRPGFCRLFPLGRVYDGDGLHYILQVHECTKSVEERYPMKVSDWLEIENLAEYEKFARSWHDFRNKMSDRISTLPPDAQERAARYILQLFYVIPYDPKVSFYPQYEQRLGKVEI